MLAGRLSFEKGRQRLNEVLKGHLDIEWMGHFDELVSGNVDFARTIRAEFLGAERTSSVAPVPREAIGEFVEFLHSYGH